jgi:hypothetical protein
MKAKRSRGFHPYLVSRVQAESAVVALQSAHPASVAFPKIAAMRAGRIAVGKGLCAGCRYEGEVTVMHPSEQVDALAKPTDGQESSVLVN